MPEAVVDVEPPGIDAERDEGLALDGEVPSFGRRLGGAGLRSVTA